MLQAALYFIAVCTFDSGELRLVPGARLLLGLRLLPGIRQVICTLPVMPRILYQLTFTFPEKGNSLSELPPHRFIYLFLDGIGLAPAGPGNPFSPGVDDPDDAGPLPFLTGL